MGRNEEPDEELGFDESEQLSGDDVVVLETGDGRRLECVILAVVDLDDVSYAVLEPRGDGEAELLVTKWAPGADGRPDLSPIDDDAVIPRLQEILADLLPIEEEAEPIVLGPPAEA